MKSVFFFFFWNCLFLVFPRIVTFELCIGMYKRFYKTQNVKVTEKKKLSFRREYYQLGTETIGGLKVYRLRMKAHIYNIQLWKLGHVNRTIWMLTLHLKVQYLRKYDYFNSRLLSAVMKTRSDALKIVFFPYCLCLSKQSRLSWNFCFHPIPYFSPSSDP